MAQQLQTAKASTLKPSTSSSWKPPPVLRGPATFLTLRPMNSLIWDAVFLILSPFPTSVLHWSSRTQTTQAGVPGVSRVCHKLKAGLNPQLEELRENLRGK